MTNKVLLYPKRGWDCVKKRKVSQISTYIWLWVQSWRWSFRSSFALQSGRCRHRFVVRCWCSKRKHPVEIDFDPQSGHPRDTIDAEFREDWLTWPNWEQPILLRSIRTLSGPSPSSRSPVCLSKRLAINYGDWINNFNQIIDFLRSSYTIMRISQAVFCAIGYVFSTLWRRKSASGHKKPCIHKTVTENSGDQLTSRLAWTTDLTTACSAINLSRRDGTESD